MQEPILRTADISPCEMYRYCLRRGWNLDKGVVTFLMMNPSTADASVDDPTIRKCIGFANKWGYGGIRVVNLFALRTPHPDDLFENHLAVFCESCGRGWVQIENECVGPRPCRYCGSLSTTEIEAEWDPIGPAWERYTRPLIQSSSLIVAAWGCEGYFNKKTNGRSLGNRRAEVMQFVRETAPNVPVKCLGVSKKGNPYHPLMLSYDLPLQDFTFGGAA